MIAHCKYNRDLVRSNYIKSFSGADSKLYNAKINLLDSNTPCTVEMSRPLVADSVQISSNRRVDHLSRSSSSARDMELHKETRDTFPVDRRHMMCHEGLPFCSIRRASW
jgi:hypothetical protein